MEKAYKYDTNFFYTKEARRQYSRLDNTYLVPSNSTLIPPPECDEDHAVQFLKGAWEIVQHPRFEKHLEEKTELGTALWEKKNGVIARRPANIVASEELIANKEREKIEKRSKKKAKTLKTLKELTNSDINSMNDSKNRKALKQILDILVDRDESSDEE